MGGGAGDQKGEEEGDEREPGLRWDPLRHTLLLTSRPDVDYGLPNLRLRGSRIGAHGAKSKEVDSRFGPQRRRATSASPALGGILCAILFCSSDVKFILPNLRLRGSKIEADSSKSKEADSRFGPQRRRATSASPALGGILCAILFCAGRHGQRIFTRGLRSLITDY